MNLYKLHDKPKTLHVHHSREDHVPELIHQVIIKSTTPNSGQLKIIEKHANLAYDYALHVIASKWPPGERAIATRANFSYLCAKFVIRRPWPLGEKIITTNSWQSFLYASEIIKGKWPPDEKSISVDVDHKRMYTKMLKNKGYSDSELI